MPETKTAAFARRSNFARIDGQKPMTAEAKEPRPPGTPTMLALIDSLQKQLDVFKKEQREATARNTKAIAQINKKT